MAKGFAAAVVSLAHIPGPWAAELDDAPPCGSIDIRAEVGPHIGIVSNADDFPCLDDDQRDRVDGEARANARLIAAAPDLLEACRFVKAFFDNLEDLDEDDPLLALRRKFHAPVHAKIDAAIAKAEGRQ